MASVAVIGVGGVGGYVAEQAAAAGHDVLLCVRTPLPSLTVERGGATHRAVATVVTDPAELAPADWVLLATKTHQVPGAAGWLAAACGGRTRGVVALQNGIGAIERLSPLSGGVPVVPTVVLIGAEKVEPGRIRHLGGTELVVPDDAGGRGVAELLGRAPALTVTVAPDFAERSWRKLTMNAVAGPITTLTGRRLGVLGDPEVRALAAAMAAECVGVARADGVVLDEEVAAAVVEALASQGDRVGTSMLVDHLAGRPTEVADLTGAVVARARALGVEVPRCEALAALVAALPCDQAVV